MRKFIIGMSREDWEAQGGGDIYPFMHPMAPDFEPYEIVFDPVNYGVITLSSYKKLVSKKFDKDMVDLYSKGRP